jgi:hypothetical protein
MIVFPMAGESRRFSDAGFAAPKYMLPLGGTNGFACAVAGFRPYFGKEPFLFVLRDVAGTRRFVEEHTQALGISDARIVVLDAPTDGQATTVALGLEKSRAPLDQPLTIFNIDTFRLDPAYPEMPRCEGWLEVFAGSGDNWSFVAPGAGNTVLRTAEKEPISDLCCTGLYGFATAGHFLEAFAAEQRTPQAKERYVAPLYNHLIARGADIRYRTVAREEIAFCGVPDEYRALLADAALTRRLEAMVQG